MSTIVTRSGKGSPLTHNEVDANFTNLNSDKTENSAAAITGGSINNTVIGNTTPNAATFTTLSTGALTATGQTSLGGAAGSESFRALNLASSVNWIEAKGSVAGTGASGIPTLFVNGSDTNTQLGIGVKGTSGYIKFFTSGAVGTEQFRVAPTASAVNYVQVTGSATGNRPAISAQGSDANVGLTLGLRGTGPLAVLTDGSTFTGFVVQPRATNGDTWIETQRNVGFVDLIAASGVANSDIRFTPKGTGLVRFGTRTASADAAITGYIEIRDSGGTIRRLAVIG